MTLTQTFPLRTAYVFVLARLWPSLRDDLCYICFRVGKTLVEPLRRS